MREKLGTLRLMIVVLLATLCLPACTGKPATQIKLTPEQQFALAKVGALGAAAVLDARLRAIDVHIEGNPEKLRILRTVKGFLDEFNRQVAPVTTFDVNDRRQVDAAISKALDSAQRLTEQDVAELKDEKLKSEILDAVNIARVVIMGIQAILPPEVK